MVSAEHDLDSTTRNFTYESGFVARRFKQTACSLFRSRLRSESITLRHPQMRHMVQRGRFDKEFRRLLRKGARAQRRAKDRLTAKEGRLGQTAAMIPRVLLPPPPTLTPDRSQVLIALPG